MGTQSAHSSAPWYLGTFYQPRRGRAVIGIAAFLVVVSDTYFSILVTRVFYTMITEVLTAGEGLAHTEAYKELQQTKRATLISASLIVFSSTLLYFNIGLSVGIEGPFVRSCWLHPLVFGSNLDSVVNDIGMFGLGTMWKEVTLKSKNWISEVYMSSKKLRGRAYTVRPLAIQGEDIGEKYALCITFPNVPTLHFLKSSILLVALQPLILRQLPKRESSRT